MWCSAGSQPLYWFFLVFSEQNECLFISVFRWVGLDWRKMLCYFHQNFRLMFGWWFYGVEWVCSLETQSFNPGSWAESSGVDIALCALLVLSASSQGCKGYSWLEISFSLWKFHWKSKKLKRGWCTSDKTTACFKKNKPHRVLSWGTKRVVILVI